MAPAPSSPSRRASRRLDSVLVVGASLAAGALLPVAPWEVAGSAAAIVALAWTAGRARWPIALAVALGLFVGRARATAIVRADGTRRSQADAVLAHTSRCVGRGRVVSSPVRTREVLRWDASVTDLGCDEATAPWSGRIALYGGPDDLARGDEVEVVATVGPPERFWNEAGGDPRPSRAERGVVRSGGTLAVQVVRRGNGPGATIDRARARVRARIDATFAPELGAMARALVLGESDLRPEDDQAFRASGLSHLLAVSGMHLVLVMGVVSKTLEGVLVRVERLAARWDVGRAAAALGIPIAWLYAEFAGGGGSTLRAAWMATAALLARAIGRRADATRAFGISIFAMACLDPLVAFDLPFALSAGATAGLLAFARPLTDRLTSQVPSYVAPVARSVATTLAASAPCVPLLARFAPTFPLGGVLANVVAVPIGEAAALPLCLVHACLGGWPAAERGCAVVASGALVAVRAVARWASLPWLTVGVPQPTSWQAAILAVAVTGIAMRAGGRIALPYASAVAVLGLEILARRDGAPRGVLRATFLDVGQGDAAIVDLPDGQAIVVDGGGLVGSPVDIGARVIAPELRRRRRSAIAAAILTHPHPDHFGGLLAGLEAVRVGALWDTGQGERERVGGGYAALVAAERAAGVAVRRPAELCGVHRMGGATLEVLAPCPDFSSDRGPNDNSIVLRIQFGERTMLLVGDAEAQEEASLLLRSRDRLRADVLKVGHHGSRTSSSEGFLAAVAPREAIISVGRRNRFGHPSVVTLAALARTGARVWRTDRDGAVVVTTDGRSVDVRAIGSPEGGDAR